MSAKALVSGGNSPKTLRGGVPTPVKGERRGGRAKGAPNKRSLEAAAYMDKQHFNPLRELVDVACGRARTPPSIYLALVKFLDNLPLENAPYTVAELDELRARVDRDLRSYVTQEQVIRVCEELMHYRFPQLKALEIERLEPQPVELVTVDRCPACGFNLAAEDPDAVALAALPTVEVAN